jgi:hypothetical protein
MGLVSMVREEMREGIIRFLDNGARVGEQCFVQFQSVLLRCM